MRARETPTIRSGIEMHATRSGTKRSRETPAIRSAREMPLSRSGKKRAGGTLEIRSVIDWSSLPNMIWSLIFEKLYLEDVIICSTVCSCWSSIVTDLKSCCSEPRVPWLMLPPKDDDNQWRLLDIARDKMRRIHLPELHESTILGSSEGWLILADQRTADLRLFNPFTRASIHLPPSATFPTVVGVSRDSQGSLTEYHIQMGSELQKWSPEIFSSHLVCALVTSDKNGYTVVVRHTRGDLFGFDMVFARAESKAWTALKIPGQVPYNYKCIFSKGLFYVMNNEGRVLSFDLSSNIYPPPPVQVARPKGMGFSLDKYLVSLPENGELLLVQLSRTTIRRAFNIDSKTAERVGVKGLGKYSMFSSPIGPSASIKCLPAKSFPELQGNFYFIEDAALKVFNMRVINSKAQLICDGGRGHQDVSGLGRHAQEPVWISPVLSRQNEGNQHPSRQ